MKHSLSSKNTYIHAYEFRGLKGRYGHWPARTKESKRTFVLVYGQHATLERLLPIAEALRDYGDVYAADNPGFGGMDSAYTINEYPSLEFYAGHLEHFVTEYIPADRQLTFVGISYGFQMVTQLLASSPAVNSRTEQAVSFVGFVKHTDLRLSASYKFFPLLAAFASNKPGAVTVGLIIRPAFLKSVYFLVRPFNIKFKELSKEHKKSYVQDQTVLWTVNDHRTHAATARDFFNKNDLTSLRIKQHVLHIGVPNDHLLNNAAVTKQLKNMYDLCSVYDLNLPNHAPLDVDTPEKVRQLLPEQLREVLGGSANKEAVL